MKRLILTTALAALAGTAFAGSHTVVRMGTEGAYEPWNFINDDGEIDGFERELGDEICARAGLTCEWVTNDWDSIIPNLVSGNYDVIIAGMSVTPERDEVIDFSTPYTLPDPSYYMALSEDADLTGGVIAAQTNTIHASFLAEQEGTTLLEFPTAEDTIAAVVNGEADAVLADSSFVETMLDANPGTMVVGDPVLLGGGVGLGIRESDTELGEKLSGIIEEMKCDGSLNTLIEKWEVAVSWPAC